MGASTSSTVEGHTFSNLCSDKDTVSHELKLLDKGRSHAVRRTQVLIINNTKNYPLVHVNHGDGCGYFFSDAVSAFQMSHTAFDVAHSNTAR